MFREIHARIKVRHCDASMLAMIHVHVCFLLRFRCCRCSKWNRNYVITVNCNHEFSLAKSRDYLVTTLSQHWRNVIAAQVALFASYRSSNDTSLISWIIGGTILDGRTFVTAARDKGVPASVMTITKIMGDGGPLLYPYPNWSWYRNKDTCKGITSVYRVFVSVQSNKNEGRLHLTAVSWLLMSRQCYDNVIAIWLPRFRTGRNLAPFDATFVSCLHACFCFFNLFNSIRIISIRIVDIM